MAEELKPKYEKGQEVFFWNDIEDDAAKGTVSEIYEMEWQTFSHERKRTLGYKIKADFHPENWDKQRFKEDELYKNKRDCYEGEMRRLEAQYENAEHDMNVASIRMETVQDRIRKMQEEGFDENEKTRVFHLFQECDTLYHCLDKMITRNDFGEAPQKFVDFVKQMAREAEVLVQNYDFRHKNNARKP